MADRISYVKMFLSVAGGFITQLAGGYDSLLQLFVWIVMIDFGLGLIGGIKKKEFSSSIAKWGFVSKVAYFIIIAVCVKIDVVIGKVCFVRNIAIIWFLLCEGASVLENTAILGVPWPEGLLDVLVQAKNGFSIRAIDVVKKLIVEYTKSEESGEK